MAHNLGQLCLNYELPGKPVAYNSGLRWGIVAYYFRLLGVPGTLGHGSLLFWAPWLFGKFPRRRLYESPTSISGAQLEDFM